MIIVTGASGQLGRLVIQNLLKTVTANDIVAVVRNPLKISDLASQGIQVRQADYDQPETLTKAFQDGDKLLLISSSEIGQRVEQHRNAIAAAKQAGVKQVIYTSILKADTSPLLLAVEHRETEAQLKASGLAWTILRNGWYSENYLASVPAAIAHGSLPGSAGDGKIASAPRADYAAAAVEVLTSEGHSGKIYELAGDSAYTLTELAAQISAQSGKTVTYQNLPESEYKAILVQAGLPEPLAAMLAQSDAAAAEGGLYDNSHQLSQLIGRPTTPLSESLAETL